MFPRVCLCVLLAPITGMSFQLGGAPVVTDAQLLCVCSPVVLQHTEKPTVILCRLKHLICGASPFNRLTLSLL